jgi:hypothetical protein
MACYGDNHKKIKKKVFKGWAGVMKRGVLINEKPNRGVRERIKVGIHWSRQSVYRLHPPRSPPQIHYFSASGTNFCYMLSRPENHSEAGKISSIENNPIIL